MTLPPLRLLIVVFAVALAAACEGGRKVAAPNRPEFVRSAPSTANLTPFSLLACTPMDSDSSTVAIGPAGGTIDVGPHRLIVPAGALDSTVSITAIVSSDTINRVTLLPSGLTFSSPASLQLSYANCGLGGLILPRVAYIDESFNILDILLSINNFSTQQLSAPLHHFSDYAVAW
jgi:hypothetical protein